MIALCRLILYPLHYIIFNFIIWNSFSSFSKWVDPTFVEKVKNLYRIEEEKSGKYSTQSGGTQENEEKKKRVKEYGMARGINNDKRDKVLCKTVKKFIDTDFLLKRLKSVYLKNTTYLVESQPNAWRTLSGVEKVVIFSEAGKSVQFDGKSSVNEQETGQDHNIFFDVNMNDDEHYKPGVSMQRKIPMCICLRCSG